jgi:hypothetical protein
MWAGVKKESRPMVWCQEMSQVMPAQMHVAANTMSKHGQGIVPDRGAVADNGDTGHDFETASIKY